MRKAYLFNKNRPVLPVEVEHGKVVGFGRVIDEEFLPISLQGRMRDAAELEKWMEHRRIPEKRDGLAAARREFPKFELYRHMFSLSDQYWFQYDEKETWENLNYFTNRYDTCIGDYFFLPWEADAKKAGKTESPDLTTNGVLPKRWVQDADLTSRLYKAGSDVYRQEPLSEVLASLILQRLNIVPYVPYEMVIHGLRMCSSCRNFITAGTEFVPASHVYRAEPKQSEDTEPFVHLVRMCSKFGIENPREFLYGMIVADRILQNEDRHLGNFGFIRDAETGKLTGFAPLFDNGRCYFAGKAEKKKSVTRELFGNYVGRAFRHVSRRSEINIRGCMKGLHKIISQYPDITDEEEERMHTKIDAVPKLVEREMEQGLEEER